jgi:hypothetical protein
MTGIHLVDSSAWVEAGRPGGDPEIVSRLADLVSSGLAAMTDPVWMELYQGNPTIFVRCPCAQCRNDKPTRNATIHPTAGSGPV